MYKASVAAGVGLLAVFLLASFAYSQNDSQDKPLGDVAREQKEARKQEQKNEGSERVNTNDNAASQSMTSQSVTDAEIPAEPSERQAAESVANQNAAGEAEPARKQGTQSEHAPVRPILDRPEDSTPDVIVVPAGTELKVDLDAGKTVVPVRVGFATPIPALSPVSVQVSQSAVNVPYLFNGTFTTSYVDYTEYATVTAVTVGGKTYEIQTDTLPLLQGGTNSELRFVLAGPVSIER